MNRDIKLLTLAIFLWGAGDGLFYFIQPLYIEELGANPAQIGGLLSLMGMVTGLAFIPAGYLADRLPRKPLLLGGWVCGSVAMLICGLAQDWRGLIPGLALYGLAAYCMPVVNAYLATAAGGQGLERVFTMTTAAYTAGMILTPALGGLLAEQVSMRATYLVAAGVLVLSMTAVLGISPQRPKGGLGRRSDLRLLLNRRFLGFAAPVLLAFFALHLVFPLVPNYLADVRGWSTFRIGVLGSVSAVGTTLLSLLLGRLKGKQSRGLLLGQGLVWLSAGMVLWAPGLAGVALAFLLRGGAAACSALTQARAGNLLGEANRGLALGATATTIVLSQVLAYATAGSLYGLRPALPFLAALALIPAGIALTARLPEGGTT